MPFLESLAITTLILIAFVAPFAYIYRYVTGASISYPVVAVAAVVAGAFMVIAIGERASYFLGYYGGLPWVGAIVAAVIITLTRPRKK